MAAREEWQRVATHLVVFQHGLLGGEQDFRSFHVLFGMYFASDEVYPHVACSNATSFTRMFQTCDGVDRGGERLAEEIVALAEKMPKLVKFSLVGHSLGGLYARYCLGVLHARGFFKKVEPVNFITLATPHMGMRRPQSGSITTLVTSITPRLLDRTGAQLALKDTASEAALALSRRDAKPTLINQRMHSTLRVQVANDASVALAADGQEGFYERWCVLQDHQLRVFESATSPGSNASDEAADDAAMLSMNLLSARMTVTIPDTSGLSTEQEMYWLVRLDIDEQGERQQHCVIRLTQSELGLQWKWLVALSNACCDVRCDRRHAAPVDPPTPPMTGPPLLECMTRGHFIQALQLFKARSLYANVSYDLQVPYSLASIRAFNPYRMEGVSSATSPHYRHITMRSIWCAPFLRDTLPEEASERASTSSSQSLSRTLAARRSSLSESTAARVFGMFSRNSVSSASQDGEQANGTAIPSSTPTTPPVEVMAPVTLDDADSGGRSSLFESFTNGRDRVRMPPYADGIQLLDQLEHTFVSDEDGDAMRAMLLALQSVGWRRLDVVCDNVLAHATIIALRADANKPLSGGLDVVHHVMDTFLL